MSAVEPNLGLEPGPPFNPEQLALIRSLRLWVGAGIACCALLPVAAVLWLGKESLQKASDAQATANRAAIGVFVAAVLVGIAARMQSYKAQWQGDVVTPQGYRRGVLRFAGAVVSGYGMATAIGVCVGHPSAAIDLAVFAVGVLVFGFPNGKPMLPHPPQLGGK